MKKLLHIAVMALLIAGCNSNCRECEEYKECEAKLKQADSILKTNSTEKFLPGSANFIQFQEIALMRKFSGYKMVFYRPKIEIPVDPNVLNDAVWMRKYGVYRKRASPIAMGTRQVIYVKFDEIPYNSRLAFLQDTQNSIIYDMMNQVYEDCHIVDFSPLSDLPPIPDHCAEMEWGDFRQLVTSHLPQGQTLSTYKYDLFLNIDCNGQNGVALTLESFNRKKNQFAIPALNAFQQNNNIQDNTIVYFYEDRQGQFLITIPTGDGNYRATYNFSGTLP